MRALSTFEISKDRQKGLAGLLGGLALLLLLGTPGNSSLQGSSLSFVAFLARLNAAVIAYTVSLDREARAKFAWRLLTVALGLWCLADFVAVFGWMRSGPPPLQPQFKDLPLVSGYVAFLTGVSYFPASRMERFGNVRNVLEVALVVLAATGVAWFSIIRPVVRVGLPGMIPTAWAVVYLVLDIAALALTLRMAIVASHGDESRLFLALSAGALLISAGDGLDFYRVLIGEGSTSGLSAATSAWGAGVMALGMLAAHERSDRPVYRQGERNDWLSRAAILVPVVGVYLVLGLTVVDFWLMSEVDWVGVALTLSLALLLVARQGVITGQSEMRQYATLVEGAADLAFVCDLQGRLLLSNPALEKSVGMEPPTGRHVELGDILVQPKDTDQLLRRALAEGWSGEAQFRAGAEGAFPVALSLRPVMDERRGERVLTGTAHDLTERKARERELRAALEQVAAAREELEVLNRSLEAKVQSRTQQLAETVERLERLNQELKELDRMKSEFVTLVSHELRAPLTNIRSGVELLLNRSDNLPGEVEETLSLVSEETERLVEFVEMILDLSALDAGRFPIEAEPLDINDLARTVASRFRGQPGGDRIMIDADQDLPLVMVDERSTMSVLFHLLDNAVKHTRKGSIRIQARVDGDSVRVAVSDEGPGIPEDQQEAVFASFHRLDPSDAREVYGRGLGLYLSRRLLEAMGGSIEAGDSELGGAEFAFWLPRA